MGYTLEIGEAQISWNEDRCRIVCDTVRLDYAPATGDPTDYTSARWPSYSTWFDAMDKLGLVDLMFNERNEGAGHFEWNGQERYPLIQDHPGAAPITKEHCEYVEAKLAEYKRKFPDHIAQYAPLKPDAVPLSPGSDWYAEDQYVKDEKYDGNLVRGEWLAFWLRWAVENCKQPVFVNS